ncbi:hypothetical protein PIB30_071415 [Stylosanthes scabra]|uniref:Uncharacterized protein n=1 Tax=Stylosanthes scabra TaxID=79078 RepID=A0ABU6ZMF2_9FABA|nr:hypothetical protein [Stylosanthes scabra]
MSGVSITNDDEPNDQTFKVIGKLVDLSIKGKEVLENRVKMVNMKGRDVERLSNEDVNDGDEALEMVKDKEDVAEVVQTKVFENTKSEEICVSNVDSEAGDYEDGKDLMSMLKEQNEI